jgi:galactokinase
MEAMALAQLCQKAENEFVGVRCGLLDQASSVFGKEDEIILLDFRAITARTVPLSPNAALLLVDPGVPHEFKLAGVESVPPNLLPKARGRG